MSVDENEWNLPGEKLFERAGDVHRHDQNVWEKQIALGNAKLEIEAHKLSARANELTEKLIASNEEASKQNETNARALSDATQELANSTNSLKWATWALVLFAAVQVAIALFAYLKRN
jgi:hypothetical protein